MSEDNKIHRFESAKLGTEPFRLVGIDAEGGTCQYCGTGVVYRYWFQGSGAGDKPFYVGGDCASKTEDQMMIRIVDDFTRKMRHAQSVKKAERDRDRLKELRVLVEANREKLAALKHSKADIPKFKDETLWDDIHWWLNISSAGVDRRIWEALRVLKVIDATLPDWAMPKPKGVRGKGAKAIKMPEPLPVAAAEPEAAGQVNF